MNENILKELYKTLPLKERPGTGRMKFKFIPNENVIDRMNKTFKGNWSTNVISKEIIEDQLLIEVLVTVSNPDTEVQFSHTGFSSQAIARYKDGVNAGKIVDIGNVYKSALAKAIVNACTRWGVGLFKEKNAYGVDEVVSEALPVVNTISAPVNAPAAQITAPPAPVVNQQPLPVIPPPAQTVVPVIPTERVVTNSTVLTQAVPVAPVNVVPVPTLQVVETPVVELPKVPVPNQAIPAPPAQSVVAAPIISTPSVPVVNTVPSTPAVPFDTQPTESMEISDVQCVALNGILDMQGIEYDVLAKEAFESRGISKQIPTKEQLNYDDAVVIIKYGNDKFRKR